MPSPPFRDGWIYNLLTKLEILAYVINIGPLWTILNEIGQGGLPNGKRDWSQ